MQKRIAATLLNTISEELLKTAQVVSFRRGEYIKRAGYSFRHFCILAQGSAKLVYDDAVSNPLILEIFHKGDFFGEMEAIGMQTDNRSIVALTDGKLYCFTSEQFLDMWSNHSEVSRYILYIHCERLLREGNDKINAACLFLREKVFRLIQENLNEANYFLYTKDILAEMSGVSIRSLNRILAELKGLNLIQLSGGTIRLNI